MKKNIFAYKITAFLLAFALTSLFFAPLIPQKVHAEDTITVPTSMVAVSKTHAKMTKLGTKISIVTNVIKGWGSIRYANSNYDGSIGDWVDHALAYFSGNADERQEIVDLKAGMNAQFDQLSQSINLLMNEVNELKTSVDNLSKQLEECALKTALNSFYTEFYYSAYTDLVNAYKGVSNELDDANSDLQDIVVAMDLLYIKAMALKELGYYVTGENRLFDNKSIVELYYDYLVSVNNITSADDEKYAEVLELTQDFTLQIYSADVLQKYCVAFVSAFQHNYINQHRKQWLEEGKSLQYEVSGNIDDDVNKLSFARINQNVELAEAGAMKSAAVIAKFFTKIYHLSSFVGYKEPSGNYYAKTQNGSLNIYEGATYSFFTLPNEIEPLFKGGFTFKSSDPTAVQVGKTGVGPVVNMGQSNVTLSYVYGEGDNETVLYTLNLTFVDKKWQGGYGNEEAPYLISNANELIEYANNTEYHSKFVKLLNDVNLSGKSFSSISTLSGGFDGNNKKITGLTSSFILNNTGTVKNLTVESQIGKASDINADGNYGGDKLLGSKIRGAIVGINDGNVENCHLENSYISLYTCNYLNGAISLDFSTTLGGIVGENNGLIRGSTVIASTVYAMLSTNELYASGQNYTGNSNDLTLTVKTWVGGIAGKNSETGSIETCYVENSNVKSTAWTTYFFNANIFAGLSTKYNRINSTVYHAVIAGENSGRSFANTYYNVSDSAHNNHEKAGKDTKEGLVTFELSDGADGTSLVSSGHDPYLSDLEVLSEPFKSDYALGEKINVTGLTVIDDYGNPVYGFSNSQILTDSYGQKMMLIGYNGIYTYVYVNVKCMHYNTVYNKDVMPTCQSNGNTASVWCNDCSTFISGNELIEKSDAYCIDSENDNYCDLCGEIICNHEDDNKNHICDLCGDTIGECTDNDKNHACDTCGKELSKCNDANKDHNCDICGKKVSECFDNDNHLCDTCNKKLSDCKDANLDNDCDICGKNLCSHQDLNKDHLCDNCFGIISSCLDVNKDHTCDICSTQISVCLDSIKDHNCDICGKELSKCGDSNSDHNCDICGKELSKCNDENNDHNCDLCGKELSKCSDGNSDHNCDLCGEELSKCADGNSDHNCDLCGKELSKCYDNDNHLCDTCGKEISKCSDGNSDHNCDICGKELSKCSDGNSDHNCDICGKEISKCNDANNDHYCDLCAKELSKCFDNDNHLCDTCGKEISKCSDGNSDHNCDICGKGLSKCSDGNNDHNCDICGKEISKCNDANNDHYCDLCNTKISNCIDNDDHNCDICGSKISNCTDMGKDHVCDICSQSVGTHLPAVGSHNCGYCGKAITVCLDNDNNHICDTCGNKLSECLDNNRDHLCEICKTVMSYCSDQDSNHLCDLCAKQISTCLNVNKDHKCDICGGELSKCEDLNSDHNCDECGVKISEHQDKTKDKKCDICGIDYKEPVKAWVIVVSVIGGIAVFCVGLYFFIDRIICG